jgi:hypothetical protein
MTIWTAIVSSFGGYVLGDIHQFPGSGVESVGLTVGSVGAVPVVVDGLREGAVLSVVDAGLV